MLKPTTSALFLTLGFFASPAFISAAPLDLVTLMAQSVQAEVAPIKLKYPVKLPNTEAFCAASAETKTRLEEKVAEKEATIIAYLDALPEELENGRNGRDAKLEEARSEADQRRGGWYVRLMDRADGDHEKDAVEDYQKRVERAVDDRRDVIDGVISEFRTGTDALMLQRQGKMRSARDAFKASVVAALGKLEADCASGVATTAIISDFKSSLLKARSKLANDNEAAESLRREMEKLTNSRRTSVAAAIKIFQTELIVANTELKQAFEGE